jgi:hypothetical protein
MKKYFAMFVAAALAAACASNENPPAASAASVEQASSNPSTGPGFAPVSNDGTASAAADVHATSKAQPQSPPNAASGSDGSAADSTPPMANNAAALPVQNPSSAPDNTRVNARDKGGKTLTPMDQGPSAEDRKITQLIRQSVVKDGSLSFTAKNVKIITINGKVTLRGPVKTEAERSSIETAARNVTGVGQVDNQLEIKN